MPQPSDSLSPCLLLWWQCDLNLPRVWSWNVANHALFYEHNTADLVEVAARQSAGGRRWPPEDRWP